MIEEGTALFWREVALLRKRSRVSRAVIFPGPHSVYDAFQGVVPMEWTSMLQSCGLSARKIQALVRKVGKFFVSAAHDRVWRPRCEAQILHEQKLMITQRAKIGRQLRVEEVSCRAKGGCKSHMSPMCWQGCVQYASCRRLSTLGGSVPL